MNQKIVNALYITIVSLLGISLLIGFAQEIGLFD